MLSQPAVSRRRPSPSSAASAAQRDGSSVQIFIISPCSLITRDEVTHWGRGWVFLQGRGSMNLWLHSIFILDHWVCGVSVFEYFAEWMWRTVTKNCTGWLSRLFFQNKSTTSHAIVKLVFAALNVIFLLILRKVTSQNISATSLHMFSFCYLPLTFFFLNSVPDFR